jgi:hypothetical protein
MLKNAEMTKLVHDCKNWWHQLTTLDWPPWIDGEVKKYRQSKTVNRIKIETTNAQSKHQVGLPSKNKRYVEVLSQSTKTILELPQINISSSGETKYRNNL